VGSAPEQAIEEIKEAIKKTYGRRGERVLKRKLRGGGRLPAAALTRGSACGGGRQRAPAVAGAGRRPRVRAQGHRGDHRRAGDLLPVSAFPPDGTFPTGTTRYEKARSPWRSPSGTRSLHRLRPLRAGLPATLPSASSTTTPRCLETAPAGFPLPGPKGTGLPGMLLTRAGGPEDCTGCGVCVSICPAKSKEEVKHKAIQHGAKDPHLEREREWFDFFLTIPRWTGQGGPVVAEGLPGAAALFEYSGACAGCGETPYIKLASSLFGDRMLIGNATGCTSIYGATATTPWTTNADGKGRPGSNSLVRGRREFAFGMRLAADQKMEAAVAAVKALAGVIATTWSRRPSRPTRAPSRASTSSGLGWPPSGTPAATSRRGQVGPRPARRAGAQEHLGHGRRLWAYDIRLRRPRPRAGQRGRTSTCLVLDTEVYSNTGGQASKATYLGGRRPLRQRRQTYRQEGPGLIAMSYGNVYVAQVAWAPT